MSDMSDMFKLVNAMELAKKARVGMELTYFDVIELLGEIKSLYEYIAELESAQRWAPLEDPPKFDGRYLLRNIYGDVYSSKYVVKTETWVVHDFAMFTHWMPLPQPPEAQQ